MSSSVVKLTCLKPRKAKLHYANLHLSFPESFWTVLINQAVDSSQPRYGLCVLSSAVFRWPSLTNRIGTENGTYQP